MFRQYRHKYFIQDAQQILPKYIVRFKLTPNTNTSATIANKNMYANKSTVSGPQSGGDGDNVIDDTDYFYYDANNFTAITKQQRQAYNLSTSNNGSSGITNSASLLPIETSFNAAVDGHYQADPMVESKKSWLDKQLQSVEDKVMAADTSATSMSISLQSSYS